MTHPRGRNTIGGAENAAPETMARQSLSATPALSSNKSRTLNWGTATKNTVDIDETHCEADAVQTHASQFKWDMHREEKRGSSAEHYDHLREQRLHESQRALEETVQAKTEERKSGLEIRRREKVLHIDHKMISQTPRPLKKRTPTGSPRAGGGQVSGVFILMNNKNRA